jgi:thiamine phosphate synthase YjbQ (UPF0047 family)
MRQFTLFFCLILLLLSSACGEKNIQADTTKRLEAMDDYSIVANGDLHIKIGKQTTILEIDALPDSQIRQDERQRLLILSDPSNQYKHGILGDDLEASSVTIVQLSDQPAVISKFSVPVDWVIESILPIWSDWDGDGEREIVLTLSNSTKGSKLVLYDENGNVLAESSPIGKGFRWRHALAIESFGEDGQRLLVEVQTPHIGGIVGFYSWDKEKKLLKTEATLPGYSTHDIGSRNMEMYALVIEEQNEQVLLILPSQSKTELTALRFVSGVINEEWHIQLGGKLSGNLELIYENDDRVIRTIVDNNREVLLNLPKD